MPRFPLFVVAFIWIAILCSSQGQSQLVWQKIVENPVLPAWAGDVDDPSGYKYVIGPSVLYDSVKGEYKMWFTSLAFGFGTHGAISYATSSNGQDWFFYAKNPIFRPGSFSSNGVAYPDVHYDGTEYKMYYTGDNGAANQTGLATSPDGIHWTEYAGNPVISVVPGTWESNICAIAKVHFDGSTYKMLYWGSDGSSHNIGLATSSDGLAWTKHPSNPVLQGCPPGSWDEGGAMTNSLIVHDGIMYLFYTGGLIDTTMGFATSTDGVAWTKYAGNPVFPVSLGWDARVYAGSMLLRNDVLHYWYSGQSFPFPSSNIWQVGYATSPFTITDVRTPGRETPVDYILGQCYPNPFNPKTEITYSVPKQTHVTIRVFDGLGKEVQTIVNDLKTEGSYTVAWDASRFASGVYWYRMTAGDFTATKKMMLVK